MSEAQTNAPADSAAATAPAPSSTRIGDLEINGQWQPHFKPVLDAFASNFAERGDVGASFAVVHKGELVVDIWGGHTDVARTKPWQENTLINVFSTTKTMTFLAALVLADRGTLDLHAPVAKYWPEFAQAGKGDVRVSHLLAHSAGLPGLDVLIEPADLYDWHRITDLLAAQAPWWEPGTASGYHALTQGYLIGEVIRRLTGRSFGLWLRDEITGPIGADFHVGVSAENDSRVALLIPPTEGGLPDGGDPNSIAARTFRSPPLSAAQSHEVNWRRAEIPAANGHGNARSVALTQAALVGGGLIGKNRRRLISDGGARRALEAQVSGMDLVLGVPITFGMGYGHVSPALPLSPNKNVVFWGGWGGSTIVIDFDAQLVFSYVMNRMEPGALGDPRGLALGNAVYAALSA